MIPRAFVYMIFVIYGGVFPVYWSHRALKSGNAKEINSLLIRWIILTIYFKTLILTNALFGFWLPFYNEIILLIFIWLSSDSIKGDVFIYKSYLNPFLAKHEEDIENYLTTFANKSLNAVILLASAVPRRVIVAAIEAAKEKHITILNKYKILTGPSSSLSTEEKVVENQVICLDDTSDPDKEVECLGAENQKEDTQIKEELLENLVCDHPKTLACAGQENSEPKIKFYSMRKSNKPMFKTKKKGKQCVN